MLEDLKSDFKYHPAFTAVILILFIGQWSTLYMDIHMDVDMGWLLQCLERFLAGGTYKTDFYETNPPLSFLIYLPAYPLYSFLGIGSKLSVFIVFMIFIIFSNFTLYALLKTYGLKTTDIAVIICACLMGETWASAIPYGSKDHLILIFMLPLCLYQYLLTVQKQVSKFTATSSIIMGGLAICLKPHYGIITAIFFLHRLYSGRPVLSCIKAPDFLGLLACGITYTLFILWATPEYFSILPEVLSIYGVERPYPLSTRLYYASFGIIGFALGSWVFSDESDQKLRYALYGFTFLSLVSFIPYILQDKGWHYHAMTILCYGMMALFLAVYGIAKKISNAPDIAIWAGCGIIALLSFMYTTGGKAKTLTNGQYLAQPLVDIIDENAWNKVYATYDFKNLLTPLPSISKLENGSRFGQLWPLNGLVEKAKITTDEQERKQIKEAMLRYVDMIVEDIKRFNPSVITIPQYVDPETNKPGKKYHDFLMKHEEFKQSMDNYIYLDTILFDSSLASNNSDPEKIIPHDVFVLKRENTL